jgi:hypothetical protein
MTAGSSRQSNGKHDRRVRWRFPLQAAALLLGITAPFGLYAVLQVGADGLAVVFFGLIILSLLLTLWMG